MHRRAAFTFAFTAAALLTAGCSNGPSGVAGAVRTPAAPPDSVAEVAAGATLSESALGSCHVQLTGDVNREWSSGGGFSAVGYGPWMAAAGGTSESAGIALDESFFLLNCQGDGENYVGFGAGVGQKVPMAAGSYSLPKSTNMFGTSDVPSVITILTGIDGTGTNWGLLQDGTLTITTFDADHVAGTFSATLTDLLDAGKGIVQMTGQFDYANPN